MYVYGTDANNTFSGYNGNDTYYARKGNDRIYDYKGNDTYQFYRGDGQDTITDSDGSDTILFGAGIAIDDLTFTRSNNNVLIGINGTTDVITVANWYTDPKYRIENIRLNDGTIITGNDIELFINPPTSTVTGGEGNDVLNGNVGKDTIYGGEGDDTLYGGMGNDFLLGEAGNDIIDGGRGVDTMAGGSGNDTYYVNNSGDIVIEEQDVQPVVLETVSPLDSSWITSSYLKDIYTRTYPRIAGNQWHVSPDGMFFAAATYTNSQLDLTASWQKDKELLDIASGYLDFITLNRAGSRSGVSTDYNDLFLDNYDSTHNPEMGLLKTRNDIYADAANFNRRVYVLPYINMSDVWDYESVNRFPEWNFWQKPNGENIGSWDYMMNNNLVLRSSSGNIIYYYSNDTHRPFGDPRLQQWRDYYVDHAIGIVNQGFDGIYSDNWWRTRSTGNLGELTSEEFAAVQEGWNEIGEELQEELGDNFLIGNSPPYSKFTSRDVCMLEDRIDDVLGTSDKSIASYFMYSDQARQMNQVCEDSYYDESRGPFETFRLPINLMTDNIFAVGTTTNQGTKIQSYFTPVEILGEIGYPMGDREILAGTDTGIADVVNGYSVERCVYVRYFSEGLVYLNNSGSQQTVIVPDGEWLRSDGQLFNGGDSVVIDNVRGWVFKKQDITPPTPEEKEGLDTIISTVSYTLSPNVENLMLSGTASLVGAGNDLDNTIIGNTGNDTLFGAAGNDTLMGNMGNDTYLFNIGDGEDFIYDSGGNDTIVFDKQSSRDNFGFIRDGNDIIFGILGYADTMTVKNWYSGARMEKLQLGDGTIFTGDQIEHIIDGTLIYGTSGADTLTGNTAQTTLVGGTGDDTYIANNSGATIVENQNEGNDTIQIGASYTLNANLENLILTDTLDISGTGNTLSNVITGNLGNDTLSGQTGNDTIIGYTGNDTYLFTKGDGYDLIQDSGGSDILKFAKGISKSNLSFYKSANDLIISINSFSDKITVANWFDNDQNKIEKLQFSDNTSISSQNIDNIINTPFYGITPTVVGTDGDNTFKYYYGSNIYYGKKGNDQYIDPLGNDTYLFKLGDGQDKITDSNGTDKIVFDQGISRSDLTFSKVSTSNLLISINGTTDSITIANWNQSKYRIEKLQFSDGTFLTSTDINGLIQQVTAYSSGSAGQLSGNDLAQTVSSMTLVNSSGLN